MEEEHIDSDSQFDELLEEQYITTILSGDTEPYRILVLAHQSRIYSLIHRQVRDQDLAEELTQDTFVRAFRALASFKRESKFSTWLTQISINVVRSHFSSRYHKDNARTDFLEPGTGKLDELARKQSDTFDHGAVEEIEALACQLSIKLREVFVLCIFEQYSYQETSEVLGIPIGTVRSRLSKARELIRKLYFSDGDKHE